LLPEYEGGRDQAFAQQGLLAVEVGEDRVEQARPLGDRRRQMTPLGMVENQGQHVELPRAVGPERVGMQAVGDAVGLDRVAHEMRAARERGFGQIFQPVGKCLPVGSDRFPVGEHFVVTVWQEGV